MLVFLLIIWIIFNGKVTLEIVAVGLVISSLIYLFMCKFMGYSFGNDIRMFKKIPLFLRYLLLIIIEIAKANFYTMKMITSSRNIIEPVVVRFKVDLKTEFARVLLANSITLTPGTITVALEGDSLIVHAIDKEIAEGIEESEFIKMLRLIER